MLEKVVNLLYHTGHHTIRASSHIKTHLNVAEGLVTTCENGLKELEEKAKLHGVNIAEVSDWLRIPTPDFLRMNVDEYVLPSSAVPYLLIRRIRALLVDMKDRYDKEGEPSWLDVAFFCPNTLLDDIQNAITLLEVVKDHINVRYWSVSSLLSFLKETPFIA